MTWEDVDINHLDIKDPKVYDEVFKSGNTVGIFQCESVEARSMCIQAQTSEVEDIVVVNAANRPGTKDQFPGYCQNKLNPERTKVVHPALLDIFKDSHSVMMYQEQALSLLRYAGFGEAEVDVGRRAIGKKIESVMKTLEPKFKKGLHAKDWTDDQANEMWELLVKQSSYSFNRSHSVAYSLLSYLTAYLKTHHPVEFMTACLINSGDTEKTSQYIVEMDRLGITLGPPDINKSGETFTPDTENKAILYGIKNINNFKTKFYETIISNRPFSNFKEYLQKTIDEVDKTSQIALIKAGAFSKIANSSKKRLIKYYFSIRFDNGKETKKPIKKINKTHIKKLYDSGLITEEQKEDKDYCLKTFNDNRKKEEWKKFSERILSGTELEWEMDTLNTFLSGDPFDGVWLPDWSQVPVGKSGHIGGVITSQKVNVVKKGKSKGQKMAFLNLNTKYGVIDCVCFADKYKDYNQVLSFGKVVVIRATKTDDEKCTLQDAMTLQKYLIKTSRLQGGM